MGFTNSTDQDGRYRPSFRCACGFQVAHRVEVARQGGGAYRTEFVACSQCKALYHWSTDPIPSPGPSTAEPARKPALPGPAPLIAAVDARAGHDNGILASLSSEYLAHGSQALPDPATAKDEWMTATLEAGWLGWVRITYRRQLLKRRKTSWWTWSLAHAERVEAPQDGSPDGGTST